MEAINQEFNQPVTRGEFKEFTDSIGEVITDIVEKGNKKTVDTVLTAMDAVAKEVKTMREEQAGKLGRDDRQDDDLRTLDTRVTGVERRISIEPV
ncbi:MAG: hypothetical protein Q8P78_01265 [bacterium]|nr:hypothetical protein [bacterium]